MNYSLHEYDYIIIGAGSAGCVLANRLSRDPSHRVCLIEAGGSDRALKIHVPAGLLALYKDKKRNYLFESVPQKNMNDRRMGCPRGKMLGGSSSMNSMIYIRGHRSDYDRWAELGCDGWSYEEILPFFKRMEQNLLGQDPEYHGTQGELTVDRQRDPNSLSLRFIEAAAHCGYPRNDDFNGVELEGVGIYNVTQRNARRLSSYRAFIAPIKDRSNLTILTDCQVLSLKINGTQVEGVYLERNGEQEYLVCRTETVLSAGAIGSPQILMSSGIGDSTQLKACGIDVKHDLPGVGKNLQDHLDVLVTTRSYNSDSLGISLRAAPRLLTAPFDYLGRKMGLMTTNYVEAGGFVRTALADNVPDIQFHFVPGYRSHRGRLVEYGHGYALHTCLLRPKSRGSLTLRNVDNRHYVDIDYNFLDHPDDAKVMVEAVRVARRILADKAFDNIRGKEMQPGAEIQSDEEILGHLREACNTVFHPVGTCKMGIDDMSVVDSKLKVIGIDNLRVIDASIMPTLISGNTSAPTMMIGEKGAEMILSSQDKGAKANALAQGAFDVSHG